MSNVDRPSGLRPVGHLTSASYNGKVNIYYHNATDAVAIFRGDLVQMNETAGELEATGKFPSIIQSAAEQEDNVGVAVGFGDTPYAAFNSANLNSGQYCPASTAMYIAVVDDPNVIFEMQEDGAVTPLTADDVGKFVDVVVGSGNTTSGQSAMEIDSDTVSQATAGTLRLLRLVDREDNVLGAYAKWLVTINEHLWNHNENVIAA